MTHVDWNEELKKIEREYDGLPPEPSPAELRALRAEEHREQRLRAERAARRGVWGRLLLVAVLVAALFAWPYARQCGAGLYAYLAAGTMIVVGGLWVVAGSWRHRMAKAHGVALLIVLWGLTFLAAQVLPRTGYARTDTAHPKAWRCMTATSTAPVGG